MDSTAAFNDRNSELTGRRNFTRNLLFSWGGYVVNLIAGFILPRMVDGQLGQFQLGIWDFAWSMIGYLGMMELGIGHSVNRIIARGRVNGDVGELIRSVSTMSIVLKTMGGLAFLASVAGALFIVPVFSDRLGDFTTQAQWIVCFLGVGVASEIFFGISSCTIVASHRWDVHNTISSSVSFASTLGMIVAMLMGAGLVWLAAIQGVTILIGQFVRCRVAMHIFPEIKIDRRTAKWSIVKEQARFSAKSLIPVIADVLVNQTVNVFLVMFAGPAALAVFSRPRALSKHLRTLVGKFCSILIPSASAYQALDDQEGLRGMFLLRSEQSSLIAIPGAMWLIMLGGPLVGVWMGKDYFHPGLVPVISLGLLVSIMQDPPWAILAGLNRHGGIAKTKLAGSLICVVTVLFGLQYVDDKLLGVAVGITLPLLVVDGYLVPLICCRVMGVPLKHFYWVALIRPLILFLPVGFCLVAVRLVCSNDSEKQVAFGVLLGGLVQVYLFYKYVIPPAVQAKLSGWITRARKSNAIGDFNNVDG